MKKYLPPSKNKKRKRKRESPETEEEIANASDTTLKSPGPTPNYDTPTAKLAKVEPPRPAAEGGAITQRHPPINTTGPPAPEPSTEEWWSTL